MAATLQDATQTPRCGNQFRESSVEACALECGMMLSSISRPQPVCHNTTYGGGGSHCGGVKGKERRREETMFDCLSSRACA